MWILVGLAAWALGALVTLVLIYAYGENEERLRETDSSTSHQF